MAAVFLWSLPIFLVPSVPAFVRGVQIDGQTWASIGYLAIFCSIVPFIIWTAAIKHLGALTSAVVLLAELVFGVIIARIALGEMLTPEAVAGCSVIAAAILAVGVKT
jgi:drug/metabolite transporter (DMT)-like permease